MDVNSISKITLRSTDFARTERFYSELFGWKFHQYSPTYLGFQPPSGIDGGFHHRDSFIQGDSYLIYIQERNSSHIFVALRNLAAEPPEKWK